MTAIQPADVVADSIAATHPCVGPLFPFTSRTFPVAVRVAFLMLAGAMPVSAIPLFVAGLLPMDQAAPFLVIPLALVAVALMVHRSPEAMWAVRGVVAGLVAMLAYDLVRIPLVWANVWPDFIPQMGGWVLGTYRDAAVVGYTWRFLGDGGGIGLAFFVFCGVAMTVRPSIVTSRPMLLSVGYGVFIWSGLMATVTLLPRGEEMMFEVSAVGVGLTLLGHLIYGAVLGVFLRRAVRAHLPHPVPTPVA